MIFGVLNNVGRVECGAFPVFELEVSVLEFMSPAIIE